MARSRSYVAEARRRGLGTRKERIVPIVERLAAEHEDATIALRFRTDVTPPLSAAHAAIGAIEYGDGETGTLVYVKASVTGDEADTILQYRQLNPTFPQESSDNQFFTEAQFESYRSLGEHVVAAVIEQTTGREARVGWPVDLRHVPAPLMAERA